MGNWQPPIPSGALWCKPMRDLGSAKSLIEYCYDIVLRDGWCKFKLIEVADTMEEPYINVKRWWKAIQDANETAGFFVEIKNRGVKGIEVRFNDRWIDWRVLESRTESAGPRSTKEVSNQIPLNDNDDPNSIKRSTKEVSSQIPLSSGNKVLITTDQAVFADVLDSTPQSPIGKPKSTDRTPEQQAYLDRKKAIEQAYTQELGYTPAAFAKEAKAAKWLAEQPYTPDQVVKCYRHLQQDEFYVGKHISLQTISKQIGAFVKMKQASNGHAPGYPIPPTVAAMQNQQPAPPSESRRGILAERRKAHEGT